MSPRERGGIEASRDSCMAFNSQHCQILPPYLTVRLHSDKPSPSPTGPIGTLNVPLNRFKFERLTSVSEFSREKAGRKAGRKTVAAAFRVFKQFYMKRLGTEMRGSWLSIGFPNCID